MDCNIVLEYHCPVFEYQCFALECHCPVLEDQYLAFESHCLVFEVHCFVLEYHDFAFEKPLSRFPKGECPPYRCGAACAENFFGSDNVVSVWAMSCLRAD